MASDDDQPWRVFASRPAPLAALFRSQTERIGGSEARDEDEDAEDAQAPPGDAGRPRRPSGTVG